MQFITTLLCPRLCKFLLRLDTDVAAISTEKVERTFNFDYQFSNDYRLNKNTPERTCIKQRRTAFWYYLVFQPLLQSVLKIGSTGANSITNYGPFS